jgi:hypothetical protein
MTPHEKLIIIRNVRDAVKYGTSAVLSAYTALKDYNYRWTEKHKEYAESVLTMVLTEVPK